MTKEKFKFIEDIERGYDPIFDDVNEYELAEKRAMQEELEAFAKEDAKYENNI